MTRPKKEKPEADFLSAPDLARKLGLDRPETVTAWVARGAFPPPWTTLGPCRRVWLNSHYEAFKRTGQWPAAAWRRAEPSSPG